MADEPKNNPAGGTDGGKQQAPPSFALPDELKGKSVEDVAKFYSDRYKDYDDLKTRAGEADAWNKIGKRDEIESTVGTYRKMTEALRGGKVIVTDERGQIFAKDRSELTPAEKREVKRQETSDLGEGGDWLDGYDVLDPVSQGRRAQKAWNNDFTRVVQQKEQEYGNLINTYRQESQSLLDRALNLVVLCQENPGLKMREVLVRAAALAGNSADPIKDAVEEFLTPAKIEARAREMSAAQLADEKLKQEKELAERRTAGQSSGVRSPLMEALRSGANGGRTSREDILATLRDKFGTA